MGYKFPSLVILELHVMYETAARTAWRLALNTAVWADWALGDASFLNHQSVNCELVLAAGPFTLLCDGRGVEFVGGRVFG